jgi:hypothetical protein
MPPDAHAWPLHAFPHGAHGLLARSRDVRRMSRSAVRGLPEALPMRPESRASLAGAFRMASPTTSQPVHCFLHGVPGQLVACLTQCRNLGEASRGLPAGSRWRSWATLLPASPSAHGSAGCSLFVGHSAGGIGRPRVASAHLPAGARKPRGGSRSMLRMPRSAVRGRSESVPMPSDRRAWPPPASMASDDLSMRSSMAEKSLDIGFVSDSRPTAPRHLVKKRSPRRPCRPRPRA